MSNAEKAKTPCMFYAYNMCKAKSCSFLHSASNKYKGSPPRAMAKKATTQKAPAAVAQLIIGDAAEGTSSSGRNQPLIPAMPMQTNNNCIPWLWDTAAGRHLIGRQALPSKMKSCLQESPNPVSFATGGGSQPGQDSLAFRGSKILDGEEVYVLKECPPAQSIGKTVMDKGFLFVWDPRKSVPYFIAPENLDRCKLKVPRNARICASRVVEYVPQYDETLTPCIYSSIDKLAPVSTALPADVDERCHP